jgi:hypothetical protein
MPQSPILGGFSRSRSPNAADNEAINLAVEVIETKDGKVPGFLFGTAGLDLVATVGTGPIRGVHELNDTLYVVSGGDVYSLSTTGVQTLCGVIGDVATPVSMFDNGRQMMIVDGVGGWLVPGGYPLTGGTIQGEATNPANGAPITLTGMAGGLYAVNDEITLQGSTGSQSSYPILTVTKVINNPVTVFSLPNAGSAYNTGVATTTTIQGQPGIGTDLTLNVTASNGAITAVSVADGGANYAVNDTGMVGTGNGYYRVSSVNAGAVTGIIVIVPGTTYGTAAGVATTAGIAVPANVGTGFTLNVTAAGGPITGYSVANGGQNYVIGNVGFVSGGSGDATYLVTSVGPTGMVTGFSVTQGGAIGSPCLTFTQQSTTGSGSGFALTSPTFGAFVGLVPVMLPFPNPIIGGISDGFGLLVFLGSQNLAASNELDLSTWPALSYGVVDQSPDNCVSLAVLHDECYVLCEKSSAVWVDAGVANFAFQQLTGVHMEYGCMAPFSVAKAGEELLWLSRNEQGQGIVVKAAAYQIQPISTQAMIAEFDTYANLGDAIGYARQQGGHVFYVLTFPQADKTWVYDITASQLAGAPLWHRLASWGDGAWRRHWGNCFTPWKPSVTLIPETTTYQANSVTIGAAQLTSAQQLNGLPPTFAAAVFSVWLDMPDTNADGLQITFEKQGTASTPSLFFQIENDAEGAPQITVKAWDTTQTIIVSATYDFTVWAAWVNILISIDTATQQLQVFANTIVSNELVETMLTPVSISWTSAHPINGENLWLNIVGSQAAFADDGGVLVLLGTLGYQASSTGLAAGAVWNNGQTVGIVPGVTPDPSAAPVYFGSITQAALLALGGGNLPLTNPGVGTNQLWNNGDLVAIA